jgi:hypothetical protein
MSSVPEAAIQRFRDRYQTGSGQFVRWVHDKLPVELSAAQQRLLRAVADHRRVLVLGANGPGKSYAAACLTAAFLHSRRPSTVLATSGTYGKLRRTLCRPVESLQHHDDLTHSLPGEYKHSPPRIDTGDPEWFFEAARPKDAGELEGTHNDHLLAITEEADKDAVDADVIESLDSCLTDANDRHLVIANPPADEVNVVHTLMGSSAWHVERLATWDSRNVRVDAGTHPGPKIPGLLDLNEVRESWETWNGEAWPGLAEAKRATERLPDGADGTYRRDNLSAKWYRRRAGVMPPDGASAHRPLDPQLVDAAYDPDATPARHTPTALGIDVARSGDDTVAVGPHDDHLVVEYAEQGTDHTAQEQALAEHIRAWPALEIAVDAVGEGSGLADGLATRFGDVTRFKAGAEAVDGTTYDRRWGEALAAFADYLEAGGTISDRDLYEQAKVAARTVTWDERHIASRGRDGADVLSASPKDEVTERLGRSPDHFDAAIMATWIASTDPTVDDRATQATISW